MISLTDLKQTDCHLSEGHLSSGTWSSPVCVPPPDRWSDAKQAPSGQGVGRQIFCRRLLRRSLSAALLAAVLVVHPTFAYDQAKTQRDGLVRGDLSTWTQRGDSFPENKTVSVNGSTPLSTMGCSYYATFFMLCRMGIMDPLKDTAWEFAERCRDECLSRPGTGYFDPRSISELTDGRVQFVEKGNYSNYYDGQAGVGRCKSQEDLFDLIRDLTEKKGYFLVACAVGTVTNYQEEEYGSQGHYIFIDGLIKAPSKSEKDLGTPADRSAANESREAATEPEKTEVPVTSDAASGQVTDLVIGDSAFPGTRWSDNWGAHGDSIVKIYAYKLLDEKGHQVMPSARQSMYVIHETQGGWGSLAR